MAPEMPEGREFRETNFSVEYCNRRKHALLERYAACTPLLLRKSHVHSIRTLFTLVFGRRTLVRSKKMRFSVPVEGLLFRCCGLLPKLQGHNDCEPLQREPKREGSEERSACVK